MDSTTQPVRGDIRSDGRIFWQRYTRRGEVRELWLTTESYRHKVASKIRSTLKRRDTLNANRRTKYANNPVVAEAIRNRAIEYHYKNHGIVLFKKRIRSAKDGYVSPSTTEKHHLRRANKMGLLAPDYNRGMVRGLAATAQRISECTGIKFSLDHVIPLARGGEHHHRNIQVIPLRINQMKSFRTQDEFDNRRIA